MEIILTKKAISSIQADDRVFTVNNYLQDDASTDKFNLCCVALQVKIPAHTQAAVLLSSQNAGNMMIENHCNIVERRCYMTV